MGGLARLVVGDGRGHQNEHQHRRHGFQRGDEQGAEEADLIGGLGGEQGEGDTGDQADGDLQDQAGAVEQLNEGTKDHG